MAPLRASAGDRESSSSSMSSNSNSVSNKSMSFMEQIKRAREDGGSESLWRGVVREYLEVMLYVQRTIPLSCCWPSVLLLAICPVVGIYHI